MQCVTVLGAGVLGIAAGSLPQRQLVLPWLDDQGPEASGQLPAALPFGVGEADRQATLFQKRSDASPQPIRLFGKPRLWHGVHRSLQQRPQLEVPATGEGAVPRTVHLVKLVDDLLEVQEEKRQPALRRAVIVILRDMYPQPTPGIGKLLVQHGALLVRATGQLLQIRSGSLPIQPFH